jgi:acyl-[acyl-carrier-protein]-phospholipid O-acyltransferase/long-chain-fatty-acid--[acyl-carrier-protein] ligase
MGIIPELLRVDRISAANGWFGLTTVSATVIGMAVGSWLGDLTRPKGQESLEISAAVLLGVAVVGMLFSLLLRGVPAGNPSLAFPWNPVGKTWSDLRILYSNRPMFRVALGVAFFWAIGALAQLNVDQFAAEGGAENQTAKVPLLISLVFGVGLGSVLAGIWSGGRIELGLLPLGAAGVALNAMLLFAVQGTIILPDVAWTIGYVFAGVLLFFLGVSAGLFNVPLESYLQHRSIPESRGAILAASNFLTFTGITLSSGLYGAMRLPISRVIEGEQVLAPLMSARQVFLVAGLFTIPVLVYIVWLIPQASIRFLVWLLSRTIYRVRIVGRENLPDRGGALLIPNHVSWLDGLMLLLVSSRPIRMMVYAGHFESRFMRWLADLWGAILLGTKPKSIAGAIRTAREALQAGELVCIFPEGAISRTGQIMTFKPGALKILDGADVPVIPVYLDGLWGSIFSFERGRFFWKWPKRWPYPLTIFFGSPLSRPDDVHQLRQAVQDLGAVAVRERTSQSAGLVLQFIQMCKKRLRKPKISDSLGQSATGGMLLMRTLILRRLLRRTVLADDERVVGLLLPPSVGGVIANMALALDKRVSANLNYTVSDTVMNACIEHAKIRHVLTSRKFMEKMNFNLNAEVVYLDDFKEQVTLSDKLVTGWQAYVCSAQSLARSLGVARVRADELLTIIFTSGSTGTPKGVMLTYGNIGHNVEAVDQVVRLNPSDVLIGILPFFHSFGYTITLWAVVTLDIRGTYHFSPLDGVQIGKLCHREGGTILLSTPTFLRTYLRRCEPEQFETLDVVVCGAEALPRDLADAFEKKFGVRPVEGYGTTELSPLVSVNIPPSRASNVYHVERKEGAVGRPVPGVSAKVVDLDTGADLGTNKPGMLLITGPNVMAGYLDRPDLTAEVMRGEWYVTGDVAVIDDDGFIQITGRESRFSKIGGEMVPHLKIEEILNRLIGMNEEDGLKAAVTAVADPKRGERLIVLHTKIDQTPDELRKGLSEAGLPNLYIPSADGFAEIPELPVLGSGKLDLKAIKQIAQEKFGP